MAPSVPFYPLVVLPAAIALYLFWRRLRLHLAVLRAGRPLNRSDQPVERIKGVLIYVIAQRRLLNDIGPGLAHAFIFWGFLVLLATTGNYVTNGLVEAIVGWPLGGLAWDAITALANLLIGLILVSIAYVGLRRVLARPPRLALSRDAFVILALIGIVVVTELFGDAFRFAADPSLGSRPFAVLAGPLSLLLEPLGVRTATIGFGVFAWAHMLVVLAFLTYLPYSKHLHIFTSEPNVYFRNLAPRGALRLMDLEAEAPAGEEVVFGAKSLKDLTWRHLLDPLSCTECGRCMEFCPASMTGKTLSPKHFMEGLRDQIVAAETALSAAASAQRAARGGIQSGVEASDASLRLAHDRAEEALSLPLVDNAIPEEAVWQCTTCGWCVEGCPVLIEHVDSIVEIRRNLVLEESRFPKELNVAFRNMETAGNPWGQPRSARLDWAKGLDVSVLDDDGASGRTDGDHLAGGVLYWVGCAGAFDERNRKVVRAMAQLLAQAGAGNEYLFQMLAQENVATLSAAHEAHGIRTIVASCPHCFNTILNEYPQFGLAGIEVVHHTQLLDRLVAEGRLKANRSGAAEVAYHDACYLGRYNDIYDPGRRVVDAIPGSELLEMDLHHRRGMCCGAGGARMWMEEREGQRINHRRAEQALALAPDAIATACPFCLIMLRDGTTDLGRAEVPVRDVAELLADATGAWAIEPRAVQ
ncbi:MAG: (Fe-S)-binding protein [Chloroflexi bacterium]|nr:MAG: (Fe-S)-binding protein [Chloroflexota bacterium]